MKEYVVVIVGGGPNALYVLERLYSACMVAAKVPNISVVVIDKLGNFGSGCHPRNQPATNHLNRIAVQIGFGAEDGPFASAEGFVTLYDWCKIKFTATREARYQVDEEDWVIRSLFGEASEDVFRKVVGLLQRDVNIAVKTLVDTVDDIRQDPESRKYSIHLNSEQRIECVDHIILCTGHNSDIAVDDGVARAFAQHAARYTNAFFCDYIYPIELRGLEKLTHDHSLLVRGMGLVALDLLLYLTEGRGGKFIAASDSPLGLRYIPSGREPKKICLYSDSGIFFYTKARNQKLNNADLYYKGRFFTDDSILKLKAVVGRALDFDLHVFPLLHAEMFYLYYLTVFGEAALARIAGSIQTAVDAWILDLATTTKSAQAALVVESSKQVACLAGILDEVVNGARFVAELDDAAYSALAAYVSLCYGTEYLEQLGQLRVNPAGRFDRAFLSVKPMPGYALLPGEFIFDYRGIESPLTVSGGSSYSARAFLRQDILRARRGNITDPVKACIDGVLRDCRDTLRLAVENGGLSARSSAVFFRKFYRVINRLAVGTSMEVMEKICAVVEAGIIDLRQTRANGVSPAVEGFECEWLDGEKEIFNGLVFASLHKFNLRTTSNRLYQNMLHSGLIREYVLEDADGFKFNSGCVEIDRSTQCVVDAEGRPNPTLNILGVPTEGQKFFHVAAIRPYSQDPIIEDVGNVVGNLLRNCYNMDVSAPANS